MIVYHGTYDGRRVPFVGQGPAPAPSVTPPAETEAQAATPWLVSVLAAGAITVVMLVASGAIGDWD